MSHEHSREAIRKRLAEPPATGQYLRDWILGGIDGTVTTFAVVAGVIGADLSARIVLIMGFANLIADGFSMAASSYSGTKAERDDYNRLRAIEDRHIDTVPDGEREEIRQIFEAKGFAGADLERAVGVITADRERWIATMMSEEYGLAREVRAPLRAALVTFAAFVVCGFVPLAPFLLVVDSAVPMSVGLTAVTFFAIGSVKSLWSTSSWWRSGGETLAIGMAAAGCAYAIGALIASVV